MEDNNSEEISRERREKRGMLFICSGLALILGETILEDRIENGPGILKRMYNEISNGAYAASLPNSYYFKELDNQTE